MKRLSFYEFNVLKHFVLSLELMTDKGTCTSTGLQYLVHCTCTCISFKLIIYTYDFIL